MSRSLFCVHDLKSKINWSFGIKPYDAKYWPQYMAMASPVSLKDDLGWDEIKHLQNLMRKADIWPDFPARGYTIVNAEFKAGDEDQRVDLLYMRTDGALLPCELKIGGDSKDSHGQLIRYISDLHSQKISLGWVQAQNRCLVKRIKNKIAKRQHTDKFKKFVSDNGISDPFVRVLPLTCPRIMYQAL